MTSTDSRIPIGINLELAVRSSLIANRPCVVLSSGYGIHGYDEPVQRALTETLQHLGIGWVQYQYPERNARNGTSDLLISSGLSALLAVCSWVRFQVAGPIGLFGISFGANISLEAALLQQPAVLLLVNPVFDYVEYRTLQLGDATMASWADKGGVSISYDQEVRSYYRFVEEARDQNLMNRVRDLACRIVACQAEEDSILGTSYLERFGIVCPHAATHVIANADHAFTDPHAIRQFLKVAESSLHEWYRADLLTRAA